MHIAVSRELRDSLTDIALLPTGELVSLSSSAEGMQLDAYDADLAVSWSRKLGAHALGLLCVDSGGTLWVVDRAGASAISRHGEIASRVEPPVFSDLEVAALAFVEDDLVFAYQHQSDAEPDLPALVRLTRNGTVRWSSRLTSSPSDV